LCRPPRHRCDVPVQVEAISKEYKLNMCAKQVGIGKAKHEAGTARRGGLSDGLCSTSGDLVERRYCKRGCAPTGNHTMPCGNNLCDTSGRLVQRQFCKRGCAPRGNHTSLCGSSFCSRSVVHPALPAEGSTEGRVWQLLQRRGGQPVPADRVLSLWRQTLCQHIL